MRRKRQRRTEDYPRAWLAFLASVFTAGIVINTVTDRIAILKEISEPSLATKWGKRSARVLISELICSFPPKPQPFMFRGRWTRSMRELEQLAPAWDQLPSDFERIFEKECLEV